MHRLVSALIGEVRRVFPHLVELYDNTASLQDRTVTTGIVKPELVRQWGAGGPIGRASGRNFDARRLPGAAPYDGLSFEVPVRSEGDVNARMRVDASDDLASWRTVVASAPLLSLTYNGRRLVREKIEFDPLRKRYLRLTWVTPGAPALTDEHGAVLTYAELNARANQLAHALRRRGVGPEVLVGMYFERGTELVIGQLAIVKAGGAYVPFDPVYPAERIAYMLGDAKPRVLLTQARHTEFCRGLLKDAATTTELLQQIEQRVLWLSTAIVHHANRIRPNTSGLKVGGHQASSASMVTIMTALWIDQLQAGDRVSVKPHASPVLHSLNYLLGFLDERYLTTLREFGGLQSYPSRSKDPECSLGTR